MILLIDAGNSRLKIAWLNTAEAGHRSPAVSLDHAHLDQLIKQVPAPPASIMGSNVAGEAFRLALERQCRQHWGRPIRWCDTHDGQSLLQNGYRQPDELGPDRWLALLGQLPEIAGDPAWQAGAPCILASFGTATTVDTIILPAPADTAARPVFLGGLILPGPGLMNHSLNRETARLPLAAGAHQSFPTDTHAAITSGIAAAQSGAVLAQWDHALALGRGTPLLYVTGGGWPVVQAPIGQRLARACQQQGLASPTLHWRENRVLDGLAHLYAFEQSSPQSPPGVGGRACYTGRI